VDPATLASTDTSNIIDNNNFTGPDTVSLAGAKASDISGDCTWPHEGSNHPRRKLAGLRPRGGFRAVVR